MITFIFAIILLIGGYFTYGVFVERFFGIDASRQTPAYTKTDGIDYVPMPAWKIFMIQFLNIAGLGPIFGAVMGSMFGPAAFLWIVFGCIFAGAVHDFFSGMLSLRHDGASISEVIGIYLGDGVRLFMRIFTVLMLVLVGAVFVTGPADILNSIVNLNSDMLGRTIKLWSVIIFLYYILATILPIDILIGRIYPFFGAALLFMAVGLMLAMLFRLAPIPEINSLDCLRNMHPAAGTNPIFPVMFITIACGAISGF
ncbi:MAG: carbon starvation CstA family protein, partial [Candidatus Nanoarchaeia archaeon]